MVLLLDLARACVILVPERLSGQSLIQLQRSLVGGVDALYRIHRCLLILQDLLQFSAFRDRVVDDVRLRCAFSPLHQLGDIFPVGLQDRYLPLRGDICYSFLIKRITGASSGMLPSAILASSGTQREINAREPPFRKKCSTQ